MTNFIFKSKASDLQKIPHQIMRLLDEQRNQRSDLAQIKRTLDYIIKIMNHQDTMDFFKKDVDLTSHQTDLDEQSPPGFD